MCGLFKLFFTKEYPSFVVHGQTRTYSFTVKSSPWLGLFGTFYKNRRSVFSFVSDAHALRGPVPSWHNHQWGSFRWTYRRIKEKDLG